MSSLLEILRAPRAGPSGSLLHATADTSATEIPRLVVPEAPGVPDSLKQKQQQRESPNLYVVKNTFIEEQSALVEKKNFAASFCSEPVRCTWRTLGDLDVQGQPTDRVGAFNAHSEAASCEVWRKDQPAYVIRKTLDPGRMISTLSEEPWQELSAQDST